MSLEAAAAAALHKYFRFVAEKTADGDQYCFTARGRNEMALSTLTMLTDRKWAFALYLSGVVEFHFIKSTGKWKVRSSPKKWKVLLRGVETEDNLLRYEGNDLAEVFLSQVKCSKFLRLKRTSKRRDKKKDILQVRLGKLNPGEAVIASKQMTDEVKPPANRALREGQRELSHTITKLIKEKLVTIEDDEEALTKLEEQIEAVELWVDWDGKKDMKEDLRAYNSDDDGEDGDEEMKAPAKEDEEMKAPAKEDEEMKAPAKNDSEGKSDGAKALAKDDDEGDGDGEGTNGPAKPSKDRFTDEEKLLFANAFFDEYDKSDEAEGGSFMDHLIRSANAQSKEGDFGLGRALKTVGTMSAIASDLASYTPGDHEVITSVPTPKIHYPEGSDNAKYRMLNSKMFCPIDLMKRGDDDEDMKGKMDALLGDIVDFKDANNEELSYKNWSGRRFLLQKLPKNKSLDEAQHWLNKYKVLENAMDAIFEGNDMAAKVEVIVEYLLTRHADDAKDALRKLGVLPKVLDVYEMSATMEECSIGIGTWRKLVQCFKEFMQVDSISVSEDAWRKLGADVGEIKTGTFEYTKSKKKGASRTEKGSYWAMDPREELERNLSDIVNNYDNFDPSWVDAIQALYAGDHGKGKHRFACKTVLHLTVPGGKKVCETQIYPLADIKATKDTCEIFKKSIHEHLAPGINQVVHGNVLFKQVGEGDARKWECKIVDDKHADFKHPLNAKGVEAFMVGDLKFYSQMLGKEDFASAWCCLCQLKHAQWQGLADTPGVLWTLDLIKQQHDTNQEHGHTGADRMGVREYPYFDIPAENYIWPILHTLIGVGNNILDHLVEYADHKIQLLPGRQIILRDEVKEIDKEIADDEESIAHFTSPNFGSGSDTIRSIKVKISDCRGLIRTHQRSPELAPTVDVPTVEAEIEKYEKEIKSLEDDLAKMKENVKKLKRSRKSKTDAIDTIRSSRKLDNDSLYTGIDRILQRYKINRAEYHGGDLTGVDIKKLMHDAANIMKEIREYLINSLHDDSNETEQSIIDKCGNVETLLTLWDGILSNLHTRFPTTEVCDETQKFVDAAIKLAHEMGMSKTVKGHGAERHIVSQMRRVYGGLFEFDEQWAERIHQEGYKYDMKYRSRSEAKAAYVRVSNTRRSTKPQTQNAMKRVKQRFKKGPLKRTLDNEEEERKAKRERRLAAVEG